MSLAAALALPFLIGSMAAEVYPPAYVGLAAAAATVKGSKKTEVKHANPPGEGYLRVTAAVQESEGHIYRLRGHAEIETTDMLLRADEIDYDEDSGDAEARGNVYYLNYSEGDEIHADRAEYNVAAETGRFYDVHGTMPSKIEARPDTLTTSNPFYFQGDWAERLSDRYVLHNGFVTDCRLPDPTWKLYGPKFDIIPGERSIARNAFFRVGGIPLFFAPYYYKSLERLPRKSGFLMPNIGNSSSRGMMVGMGYYWAINRSYDATYQAQLFTSRGVAHHFDFRGKPTDKSGFDLSLYGVEDRLNKGGVSISSAGFADLPDGFEARADIDYLSSYTFRENWTESFYEAIFSEAHSTAYITKHWSAYGFNVVAQRDEIFLSDTPHDTIVIRKLPELQFKGRDQQLYIWKLPLWFSFSTSDGLLRRDQPLFQTRQSVNRFDVESRATTALRWKSLSLLPWVGIRETTWGSQMNGLLVSGENLSRNAREAGVDLGLPSFERTFDSPKWLGKKLKHVIEPQANFKYVGGASSDFLHLVRFDETELLSDTTEAELGLINRLYVKRNDGNVDELLSWQVFQKRYFDPTFGGAIVAGERNVLLTSEDLTAFAYIDQARNYSPASSILRIAPRAGYNFEWRADYDPLRKEIVNTSFSAEAHFSNYAFSLGHTQVKCVVLETPGIPAPSCLDANASLLSPAVDQLQWRASIGGQNHHGWSAGLDAYYDYRAGVLRWATIQTTYNTDCCGISVQFRRWSLNARNENQFLVSFAVANVGNFGNLKKQEKIF